MEFNNVILLKINSSQSVDIVRKSDIETLSRNCSETLIKNDNRDQIGLLKAIISNKNQSVKQRNYEAATKLRDREWQVVFEMAGKVLTGFKARGSFQSGNSIIYIVS